LASIPKPIHSKPVDANTVDILAASTPGPSIKPASISTEEAQLAVRKALDRGDIQTGLNSLLILNQGRAKAEECGHVYAYTLKNPKLTAAKSIVDWCWEGTFRAQRIEEINHEYQKQ
jgi:hypothetical protein